MGWRVSDNLQVLLEVQEHASRVVARLRTRRSARPCTSRSSSQSLTITPVRDYRLQTC